MPRLLMLDNGSEYSWSELEAGFKTLAGLTRGLKLSLKVMVRDHADATPFMDDDEEDGIGARKSPIQRTKPRWPQTKPIEGTFAIFEYLLLRGFPGWIGGDRMNKRTHQMGQAPRPFPGTPDQYQPDCPMSRATNPRARYSSATRSDTSTSTSPKCEQPKASCTCSLPSTVPPILPSRSWKSRPPCRPLPRSCRLCSATRS